METVRASRNDWGWSSARALAKRPSFALYLLERSRLRVGAGQAVARWGGILIACTFAVVIVVLSRTLAGRETLVATVARAAATLVAVSGMLSSLSLAQESREKDAASARLALAVSRGFAVEAVARASVLAAVGLVAEIVALPVALLDFLVLLLSPGAVMRHAGSPFGATLFALFSAVLLGLLAAACRRWGAARGRRAFLVIVLVPWLFTAIVAEGTFSRASVPGWLVDAWAALTGADS